MDLPDLTGQPGWVVVTVVGLVALSGVFGLAITRGRTGKDGKARAELEAKEPDAIVLALDHLAAVGEREAAESAGERKVSAKLREKLARSEAESAAEIKVLRAALAQCEGRLDRLIGESEA